LKDTSQRLDKWGGPLTLIASNLILSGSLLWLRGYSHKPEQSTFILTASNLIISLLLLSKRISGRPVLPKTRGVLTAVLLWAVSYCVGYYIFLAYPGAIRLSHFIIVQSLAPLCAVLLSGDWKNAESSLGGVLVSSFPIVFLLLIAWAIPIPAEQQQSGAWVKWAVIFIIFLSFLVARTAARVVVRTHNAFWLQSRLGLLTGVILLIIQGAQGELARIDFDFSALLAALALGSLIVAAQAAYMYGLSRTAPVISALFISTSIPIAILMESLWNRTRPSITPTVLSVIYCLSIYLKTIKDRSEDRRRSREESRVIT
jgi:drug/metabolite transporter (DMT)-like permease